MLHAAGKETVVAAQVAQVIGEFLAIGEMNPITRETRRHGMAGAVNDPSVGQRQGDEAGEEKISRHLVGNPAGIRCLFTKKAGIGFPELLKIAADEVPDSFGDSLTGRSQPLHSRPGAPSPGLHGS